MKAIGYAENLPVSDPQSLIDLDLPDPVPGDGDLLVKILALSVNPVDTKFRAGRPAAPFEHRVPGWDACGVVQSTGQDVEGFQPGDTVWYAGQTDRPGCNAELQTVDARLVAHAPTTTTPAQAAAMPLTSLTAWEALFERLGYTLEASDWNRQHPLLIINGAGGVGSVALQLCHLAEIPVTATASREASQDWCLKQGASYVMPHQELEKTPDSAFPRILCCHDTDRYFDTMTRLIAPQGLICALAGTRQRHDLLQMMNKSAGFVWEYMFTRSHHQTADIARQGDILSAIAQLMDAGKIHSTLTEESQGLSAANLREMHRRQEAGGLIGKQVLVL